MAQLVDPPEWCTWWTPAEWARFCGLAELVARTISPSATVDRELGVLEVRRGADGVTRYSLDRAAQHARHKPATEWPHIIRESITIGPDHQANLSQIRTADLDAVRSRLKVHVFPDSWGRDGVGSVVTRPLGANLIEALVVDVPEESASVNVSPQEVRRWGVSVDDLFALGRENLRTEPFRREEPVPGVHFLIGKEAHGMVSFAASRLLLLDEEPDAAGPYGCLVAVPNHSTLAYHRFEGPECLNHHEAVLALIGVCQASRDTHEWLSDRLYLWRAGRVTEIPFFTRGGELVVNYPSFLLELLEGGSGEPPAGAEYADLDTLAEVGARLLLSGRAEDAERYLRRAADQGHAEATSNLGLLLLESERAGGADEAERHFRRAADLGHAGALTNVGAVLDHAGRTEDAESWFRHAADRGERSGMHALGRLLRRSGRAGEAERWLRRAAEAGASEAMVDLADPLVAAKRYDEAEPWLRRAAEQDDPDAMFTLGLVLGWTERSDEATRWLSRAAARGHSKAAEVAETWFRANAESGAAYHLGKLLADTGRADEARQWFQRAAEDGDPEAMAALAQHLGKAGEATDAEHWYREAIAHGEPEVAEGGAVQAMTNLGVLLHKTGRPDEAEGWTRRAAELGSAAARRNLGQLQVMRAAAHRQAGEGAAADAALADAEDWLTAAAEAGDSEAMYALGRLCENDRPAQARGWLRKAAAGAHPEALQRLVTSLDASID